MTIGHQYAIIKTVSDQNFVDSLLDSFEDGYNQLEEANGELMEVMTQGVWKLMREAVRA
uniref:Uncharacterized protein n=1 Tax=Myoviridae sp. ct0wg9 TaxID=2826600 RepID=A0A8S5NF67_9CAUD|nr:MAG TPA: hypothetical protein [Myoviridae sp. ct0wg9]